jgi:hypothetical protein
MYSIHVLMMVQILKQLADWQGIVQKAIASTDKSGYAAKTTVDHPNPPSHDYPLEDTLSIPVGADSSAETRLGQALFRNFASPFTSTELEKITINIQLAAFQLTWCCQVWRLDQRINQGLTRSQGKLALPRTANELLEHFEKQVSIDFLRITTDEDT